MRWCLLSLACFVTLTGCSGGGRSVEYVIPDGHRGQVWVLLDPDAPDVPLVDGRYRVEFPKDGLLRVRSMQPFEQWHESSARYADGTPLTATLISGSSQVAPGTVGMWGGSRGATWPDKRDYIMWVVGTEAEFKAVRLEQRVEEISAYDRLIDRVYPSLTAGIRFSGPGLEALAGIDFDADLRAGKSWSLWGPRHADPGAAADGRGT